MKAEKQLVALLSMPLGSRDAVTVLSLDQYPPLMSLLSRRTHKDMALKVVQTVLAQVGLQGWWLVLVTTSWLVGNVETGAGDDGWEWGRAAQ
jgi:hypothetical protein